jgi:hypothetical protein
MDKLNNTCSKVFEMMEKKQSNDIVPKVILADTERQ